MLGPAIVDREQRRIDESLFKPGAALALIEAIKKTYPEVYALLATAEGDEQEVDEEDAEVSSPDLPATADEAVPGGA